MQKYLIHKDELLLPSASRTWSHLLSAVTEKGDSAKGEGKRKEGGNRGWWEVESGKWEQGSGNWRVEIRFQSAEDVNQKLSRVTRSIEAGERGLDRDRGRSRGGEVKAAAAHRNEANPNQNLMRGTNGKRGRQGQGMGKGSGSCCDSCKKLRNFCATFVCYHRWWLGLTDPPSPSCLLLSPLPTNPTPLRPSRESAPWHMYDRQRAMAICDFKIFAAQLNCGDTTTEAQWNKLRLQVTRIFNLI